MYRQLSILCTSLLLLGCTGTDSIFKSDDVVVEELSLSQSCHAKVRWTSYGIPHVLASDYQGVGLGLGYACGKDNLKVMAEQLLKVRGERARYFGAGDSNEYLNSDITYTSLNLLGRAQEEFSELSEELQSLFYGYAQGFNRAVRENRNKEEWIKSATAEDFYAYSLSIALLRGTYQFVDAIAAASPPEAGEWSYDGSELKDVGASNAWAIGKRRVAEGNSILFANPHFPWEGELKFYECHLTIPGELNISGVTLYGLPMPVIGFNEHLAWTHTVSTAKTFVVYRLQLEEGNPLSYLYEGEGRPIESQEIEIAVLQGDGTIKNVQHTCYSSHYGPIIQGFGFDWDHDVAYSIKDGNLGKAGIVGQWLGMAKSHSKEELLSEMEKNGGTPWVNTLYVDKEGIAGYVDASTTPDIAEEVLEEYFRKLRQDPFLGYMYGRGVVILEGDGRESEWIDQDNGLKGLVPFSRAPHLERTDFTHNANDSYWLTNPFQPLEGYSPLTGTEKTLQSWRTRQNLLFLTQQGKYEASLANGRLNQEDIWSFLRENGSYLAEDVLDDVLSRCMQHSQVDLPRGTRVNLEEAVEQLQGWDKTYNVGSTGGHIFREFMSAFSVSPVHIASSLFKKSFDPENPLHTPSGLADPSDDLDADPVILAMAEAVNRLDNVGIPLYSPLGDIQYVRLLGEETAIPGGVGFDGVTNITKFSDLGSSSKAQEMTSPYQIVNPKSGLSSEGYLVNYSSTYMMSVQFFDEGPKAQAILGYSQSSEPNSLHFADQTSLFSQGLSRAVAFTEEEIFSDSEYYEQDLVEDRL